MKAKFNRGKSTTIRWSESELEDLEKFRGSQSRARYIRAMALRKDSERADAIWALRNTIIGVASLVKASPMGEAALIAALDTVSKAKL